MIEAELADGTILEFPDGTDPSVIQATVRARLGVAPQEPGTLEKAGQFAKDLVFPPTDDLPELGVGYQGLNPREALRTVQGNAPYAGGDPNATLGQDSYGNPIINRSQGATYIDKPGFTPRDLAGIPGDVGRFAKENAFYLAAGNAAGPLTAAKAGAMQLAAGVMGESLNQTNNYVKGDSVNLQQIPITGILSAGGELGARLAYKIGAPIFKRFFGKADDIPIIDNDGKFTKEAMAKLKAANISSDQLEDAATLEVNRLVKSGDMGPEDVERFNFLMEKQGSALRFQVDRSKDSFQEGMEAAKRSGRVTDALESQNQVISEGFDTSIKTLRNDGTDALNHVVNRSTRLDQEISDLYGVARDRAQGAKGVKLTSLANKMRELAGSDQATKGLLSSVDGHLKSIGVTGNRLKVQGKIDVDTAESVRQFINQHYSSTNDFGRIAMRQLKDALDDDVLRFGGEDIFKQARTAKHGFEKDLARSKVSKFDKRKFNLVRKMLENDVNPDNMIKDVVISKRVRSADLDQLKSYLKTGSPEDAAAGAQAWDNLRADTLEYIKNTAFRGADGETGVSNFSRAGLDSALEKGVGWEKLKVIFDKPGEIGFLRDMERLARLREPPPGTALGRGPSAQAIGRLEKMILSKIEKVPYLADLAESIMDDKLASAAIQTGRGTEKALKEAANYSRAKRIATPLGAPTAINLYQE